MQNPTFVFKTKATKTSLFTKGKKIVVLVHRVFSGMLPKIPRNFFFRQKTTTKRLQAGGKNVTFCKNCSSGTGGLS